MKIKRLLLPLLGLTLCACTPTPTDSSVSSSIPVSPAGMMNELIRKPYSGICLELSSRDQDGRSLTSIYDARKQGESWIVDYQVEQYATLSIDKPNEGEKITKTGTVSFTGTDQTVISGGRIDFDPTMMLEFSSYMFSDDNFTLVDLDKGRLEGDSASIAQILGASGAAHFSIAFAASAITKLEVTTSFLGHTHAYNFSFTL